MILKHSQELTEVMEENQGTIATTKTLLRMLEPSISTFIIILFVKLYRTYYQLTVLSDDRRYINKTISYLKNVVKC